MLNLFRGPKGAPVPAAPTNCHNPGLNVTYPDLLRQVRERPKDFLRHRIGADSTPHEFAYIFFWSMLAYDDKTLDSGLFEGLEHTIDLRVDSKYETPFAYLLREKRAVVIGFRGTWTAADVHRTLLRMYRKGRIPSVLREFEEEIIELYETSPHRGIVYHALKSLALVLTLLTPEDRDRTLYLHGHSLGAATAVIAAHFLHRLGYTRIHVGVLSSPRIFHPKSAFLAENRITSYQHFYDENDAVSTRMVNRQSLFYGSDEQNIALKSPILDGSAPGFKAVHTHSIFLVPDAFTRLFPYHVFMSAWRSDLKLCDKRSKLGRIHVISYEPKTKGKSKPKPQSRKSGKYVTPRPGSTRGSLPRTGPKKSPVRSKKASARA